MDAEPRVELASADLEREAGALLPPRRTLCVFACTNVVTVVGVNISLAVNAASINAEADALAAQYLGAVQLH
jgi:hypothetical protein